MNFCRRAAITAVGGWALSPCVWGQAPVASYPDRPVKITVPFASGGATDILARRVAEELKDVLLQPLVVDNRAGAGGVVGAAAAAHARADGYTLLFMTNSLCLQEAVRPAGKGYALLTDLAPVSGLYQLDLVLAVNPQLPVSTLGELIAYAKARPGQLNYASGGAGTTLHLGMELLKQMAGLDILHIPYKDAPAARLDLMGGTVQMMVDTANTALPLSRQGKLKILAQTGLKRSESMPDIPTADESGLRGFQVDSFAGLMVPTGTPPAVTDVLRRATEKVLQRTDLREALRKQGASPLSLGPEPFRQLIKDDILRWERLLRSIQLKLN